MYSSVGLLNSRYGLTIDDLRKKAVENGYDGIEVVVRRCTKEQVAKEKRDFDHWERGEPHSEDERDTSSEEEEQGNKVFIPEASGSEYRPSDSGSDIGADSGSDMGADTGSDIGADTGSDNASNTEGEMQGVIRVPLVCLLTLFRSVAVTETFLSCSSLATVATRATRIVALLPMAQPAKNAIGPGSNAP